MKFTMVDGLDFDNRFTADPLTGTMNILVPVRLTDEMEGTITRGFNGSPKYQHRPGEAWRLVATSRSENDDLGVDRTGERLEWLNVGEVYVDTVHPVEQAELIQITSLTYVGP